MASAARKLKTKSKAKTLTRKKTKLPKRKAKKTKTKAVTKKSKPAKKPAAKARPLQLKAVPVAASQEIRVQVGDRAPDFTLPDQTGTPVTLSDFRGKKVVLYFYPKDDTPGCTKEACSFRDNLPTFEGADAVILGVSFDNGDSHQKFIQKYNLNFRLLSDENKEVAKKYGVFVQKNMYGNISWGIERSTFVVDRNGQIASAWRKVSVDGHTEEVVSALRSID